MTRRSPRRPAVISGSTPGFAGTGGAHQGNSTLCPFWQDPASFPQYHLHLHKKPFRPILPVPAAPRRAECHFARHQIPSWSHVHEAMSCHNPTECPFKAGEMHRCTLIDSHAHFLCTLPWSRKITHSGFHAPARTAGEKIWFPKTCSCCGNITNRRFIPSWPGGNSVLWHDPCSPGCGTAPLRHKARKILKVGGSIVW